MLTESTRMRLHHVGMVVKSVDEQARHMEEVFGFKVSSGPVDDPLQGVRVVFVNPDTEVRVELIEPLSPKALLSGRSARPIPALDLRKLGR